MVRAISVTSLKTAFRALLCCLALVAWGALPPAADAQTGDWAWMAGSSAPGQNGVYGTMGTPSATNIPGGRIDGVTWTDSAGNLWLFAAMEPLQWVGISS
jgi:hypothetical protein